MRNFLRRRISAEFECLPWTSHSSSKTAAGSRTSSKMDFGLFASWEKWIKNRFITSTILNEIFSISDSARDLSYLSILLSELTVFFSVSGRVSDQNEVFTLLQRPCSHQSFHWRSHRTDETQNAETGTCSILDVHNNMTSFYMTSINHTLLDAEMYCIWRQKSFIWRRNLFYLTTNCLLFDVKMYFIWRQYVFYLTVLCFLFDVRMDTFWLRNGFWYQNGLYLTDELTKWILWTSIWRDFFKNHNKAWHIWWKL